MFLELAKSVQKHSRGGRSMTKLFGEQNEVQSYTSGQMSIEIENAKQAFFDRREAGWIERKHMKFEVNAQLAACHDRLEQTFLFLCLSYYANLDEFGSEFEDERILDISIQWALEDDAVKTWNTPSYALANQIAELVDPDEILECAKSAISRLNRRFFPVVKSFQKMRYEWAM